MGNDTEKPLILAKQGQVITEAIAVQAALRPPVIFDKGPELDSGWQSENLGVVNIRSVYDIGDTSFDGCFFGQCETSPAAITSVSDFADPLNATADERPVRFVRFIKPVGIPDPNDITFTAPDLDNQAFGRQLNLGMREIVGYAPVEPDGSVKVKVPANVPLGVEVLDAEGRRIGPRHLNWFQVLPGDTLNCTGCHEHSNGPTPEVHGRVDGTAPSINSGIQTPTYINTQIPGTAPPIPYFSLNLGETMAEVRFDRVGSAIPAAPEPVLSADLNFVDYWTDPTVTASVPAVPYSYSYDDLDPAILSPAPPAKPLRNADCDNTSPQAWSHNCRITINYPRHIHEIWQLDRGVDTFTPLAPANAADPADPTNTPLLVDNVNTDGIGDDTCTSCHTSMVANVARLPYGQLDLTTDPNQNPAEFFRAYRELLFNDQGQEIDGMGNLVDIQILVPDGMGGFVLQNNPAAGVAASMTANGARSSFFIEKMTGTELDAPRAIPPGSVDHTAMLTGAELKLISEWLDLGAQNFNDPFDPAAPQN
jgi:hypothetical protein